MLYFIVNKTSRTGKNAGIWDKIEKVLKEEQINYEAYITEYPGHAGLLADDICSREDEDPALIVVGGDGTINEVINGMHHFENIRFGIIPGGSGNDFAGGLGLPRLPLDNLQAILKNYRAGKEAYRRLDLGLVDGDSDQTPRLFAISAGVGMDAIVCKEALESRLKKLLNKFHLGKLTYILLTVYTLFSMDTADLAVMYQEGEKSRKEKYRKVIFSAVMNTRAEGGGVPMAPAASPEDGMLSMCTAYGIPKWKAFLLFPLLILGKHEKIHGFCMENTGRVKIKLSKPMVLHADGEYGGEVSRVTFTCLPGRLKFLQ